MSRATEGGLTLSIAACILGLVSSAPSAAKEPMALGVLLAIVVVLGLVAMAWAWWLRPMNLALGLGAAVSMWTLTYMALLQPGFVVSEALFGGAILCVLVAGFVAGRMGTSQANGLSVGLIAATFNLMIVGSALGKTGSDSQYMPALYAAGLFGASALLGWVGQLLGARSGGDGQSPTREPCNATLVLCCVNAAAILVLIVLGGLVTSHEAGLAVPDWPHTFGHNMLLYPVSQMEGGVFYEHAHRLFGTLVGVATLVTAATVFKTQSRRLPRILVSMVLLLVITQGILGGLRVTGTFSTATDPAQLNPSEWGGVAHGVLAQLIFALSAVLPLTVSWQWSNQPATTIPAGSSVRMLPLMALCALIAQLFLGVAARQLQIPANADQTAQIPKWALHGHITMAVVVLVLVILAGLRCAQVKELPGVQRLGKAAMHTVGLQVMLGILALVAVLVRKGQVIPWWESTAATSHQAVGALLLAVTAMLVAQTRRFVAP